MSGNWLQITYRTGRFFAAYLYLEPRAGEASASTEQLEPDLLVDFAADGRPLGVEILSPDAVDLGAINARLERAGHAPLSPDDLAPLTAA